MILGLERPGDSPTDHDDHGQEVPGGQDISHLSDLGRPPEEDDPTGSEGGGTASGSSDASGLDGVDVTQPKFGEGVLRCSNGHEWGPGLITVSLVNVRLPACAGRLHGRPAGAPGRHCNAAPGCRSVWYRLRHERGT